MAVSCLIFFGIKKNYLKKLNGLEIIFKYDNTKVNVCSPTIYNDFFCKTYLVECDFHAAYFLFCNINQFMFAFIVTIVFNLCALTIFVIKNIMSK